MTFDLDLKCFCHIDYCLHCLLLVFWSLHLRLIYVLKISNPLIQEGPCNFTINSVLPY